MDSMENMQDNMPMAFAIHEATGATLASAIQVPLQELLEQSFARPLIATYWTYEPLQAIIHEKHYRAAAILKTHSAWLYLDKFAVAPSMQRKGLGTLLFSMVVRYALQNAPGVFWRTAIEGQACSWFMEQAERYGGGYSIQGKWMIGWIGTFDMQDQKDIVNYAMEKEVSFEPAQQKYHAGNITDFVQELF
jgi:acetylglutamate synthase